MAKYKIIPSSRTIVQSPISIGHKAEKGVEAIEFDLTAWVETYGSGTLTVIMRRWGDAIPYPIALEIDENNKATWTLSDTDTAKAGMAYAQLSYIVGETVVKKSDIYTFRVMDSLTGEGEPPEAYESWLEHLTHLAAEAMAEVLDIEGIVTDKTLTVDGGIADAKATGDALALKADKSTTYTKTEVDQMISDVDVETDTTLSVSGAAADAKKTGDEIAAVKADLSDMGSALPILKASILFGYFNIDTANRTIGNINTATLIDSKHRTYKFVSPTTIQLPTESGLADIVYMMFYKISSNNLFIFVPTSNWSEYKTLTAELNNNPRDYLYLFSFYCRTNGTATYLDVDSFYRYRVDGIYYNNDKTNFYIFRNRNRIMPYTFFVNFLSISSFKVTSIAIPNDDGASFRQLTKNYVVDWSDLPSPSYTKLITLNNTTEKIEVISSFTDDLLLTHSYIGIVTNGSIADITLTTGNAVNGNGVSKEDIYGISSDIYRDIFNRFDNLYKLPMKVGVIGDSLSVGYMRNNARVLPYSWVKQIGKDSGNQWLNFGASGYTTLLWCSSQTYGKIQMETPGNKCQVYIIGLGVNDCAGTHPIPLGSQNDIVNNPDTVATTFYGGYARIIQLIKRLNPNAIIICLTIPKLGDNFNSYNNAIRYITDTYYATDNNVLLLDIANDNMELFNDSSSKLKIDSQKTNAGGHFTAYGYRMIATFMEKKLNSLIYNNSAFENIPFIEYDDTAPVGDV